MKLNIGLILLIVALVISCGGGGSGSSSGGSSSSGSSSSGATLVSLAVNPTNPSIAVATSQQFTATGIFSDNSTQDLTTSVTWSSSATSVVTIDSNGKATSVAAGSATIKATSGSLSGATTLTVTSASLVSLAVNPTNPSIAVGTPQQFTATGIFSDNSAQDITTSVIWSSSAASVAAISNIPGSDGKATSAAVGTTTIKATSGSISGSTSLTVTPATLVSISVTPTNPSIAVGTSQQFTATGIFSDNSTQDLTTSVTWQSAVSSVAAISNAAGSIGNATSVSAGTTTISATYGSISGSTTLTVTRATLSSITLTATPALPPTPITTATIPIGFTQQFFAIGTYSDGSYQNLTASVTWSSSAPSVAAIAGTQGIATSLAAGITTITATYGSGSTVISGSATLNVNSTYLKSISVSSSAGTNIAVGAVQPFTATGTFSDGSTKTVTSIVVWTSSAPSVATVSNAAGSNGIVTAVAAGTATITATYGSIAGSATLTVTTPVPVTLTSIVVSAPSSSAPANPGIVVFSTLQFTAQAVYSDGSTQDVTSKATWSSSNTLVATIASGGLATSLAVGTTTITATYGTITSATGVSAPGTGSVLLTVTKYPAGTYQVGVNPAGIAIDAAGDVWMSNSGGNSITELLSSGTAWVLGNTFSAGSNSGFSGAGASPFGIAIDYSGDLWFTNYNAGTITVVTLNAPGYNATSCAVAPINSVAGPWFYTFAAGGTGPRGIAIDSGIFSPLDQFNVWVANYGSTTTSGNTVTKLTATLNFCSLSMANPALVSVTSSSLYTVGTNPDSIAIDSSGNVWVSNYGDGTVTELSSSGSVLGTFPVGTGPRGIAIDPSGNVWVANAGSDAAPGNTVTELSSSGTVLGTFQVGSGPYGIAIETSGNVWVANYGTTTVPGTTVTQLCGAAAAAANSVVNGVTCKSVGQQVQAFPVGKNPDGIVIDFSGNVWVANYYDNTVTELQGKTTGPHYSPYSGPIWP